MTNHTDTPPPFDQWCFVELLGHRRIAAHVTETTIAGAGMLRLDIPPTDTDPAHTTYVAPAAVYALHPTTEAMVRQLAPGLNPQPVAQWELPARTAADVTTPDADDHYGNEWDDTAPF